MAEKKQRTATGQELSESELEKVEERTTFGAHVVHEAIRIEGEGELERPVAALAWSGLAAGLSMGFSFLTEGLLRAHLPATPVAQLVAKLGYSIGFLIVVLGRQQLYTENTLTPVLPLMAEPSADKVRKVLRLWGVVFLANIVGTILFSWAVAKTGVFTGEVRASLAEVGHAALSGGFRSICLKGVFGGWLVALMVWLLPGSETSRPLVIILLTYLIALGGFAHVIAGSADVFFLVARGEIPFSTYLFGFVLPALAGNTLGGLSLVAALNHAQVIAGRREKHA